MYEKSGVQLKNSEIIRCFESSKEYDEILDRPICFDCYRYLANR